MWGLRPNWQSVPQSAWSVVLQAFCLLLVRLLVFIAVLRCVSRAVLGREKRGVEDCVGVGRLLLLAECLSCSDIEVSTLLKLFEN